MTRPVPFLSFVACCLPLTGCFGCVLDLGDPGYDDDAGYRSGDSGYTYEVCNNGPDIPRAPKNSTIHVNGSAQRADGTPMSGTVLMRDPATSIDVLVGVFTLGLGCLKADLSGLDCGEWRKLTLDGQGKFSLSYPEEDTHGLIFDKTFDFLASAPAQPSGLDGAAMVITAWFSNAEVKVPMKLWEPEVRVTQSGGKVEVSATPLIARTACDLAGTPVAAFTLKDGTGVWSSALGSFDARTLEDFDGQVAVSTDVTYVHSQVGEGYYTSAAQAFKSTAGAPPSRGAACNVAGQSYAAGTCPFTDGKWASTKLDGGFAIVDLGSDKSLSLVVLRGSFDSAELSVAADGKAWTSLKTEIQGGGSVVTPPSGTTARYVKLAEPVDSETKKQPPLQLVEISTW
ncbi:MAG: discoidin domain-containing protein [Myxococcales bacterium]